MRILIPFFRSFFALSVLGCAVLSEVDAQECIGIPMAAGERSVTAAIGLPAGATVIDATLGYHTPGRLSVFGSLGALLPDAGEAGRSISAGVGIAAEAASLANILTICPRASVGYSYNSDVSSISIPVGIGLGARIPLGHRTVGLLPYAIPQLLYNQSEFGEDSDSDTNPYLQAGLLLGVGAFYGGVTLDRVITGGAESTIGVRGGFTF